MADTQVLNTLNDKRKQIESHIGSLEQDLEQARRDLSAVLATMKVFSADGPKMTAYMNMSRLFPRHELPRLITEALQANPDGVDTRQIALHVIEVKGLDAQDRHLRKSIAYKCVQVLRRWERRRQINRKGKRNGAIVWASQMPVVR